MHPPDDETHVNEYPVTGGKGSLVAVTVHLRHDLTGDPEAHGQSPVPGVDAGADAVLPNTVPTSPAKSWRSGNLSRTASTTLWVIASSCTCGLPPIGCATPYTGACMARAAYCRLLPPAACCRLLPPIRQRP